jgi:ABC-2 type transport system ATP-binding protein
MIELQDVSRRYGTKLAVEQLNLEVQSGEVFAFLGPNGAGKTTTIKMVVGLIEPTVGRVRVDGIDVVTNRLQAKARLGYVPDQPELYDKLSGREFLTFVARLRGMNAADVREGILRSIADFELEPFVDRLTEGYSHGMKQRVAFAAALIHDPRLLVLDEPMVGLDPRSTRLVKDLLRQRARNGRTVFLSTHTLAIAEEIADRIGVIHNGSLRFVGTCDQLRQQLDRAHCSLEELYLALTDEGADLKAALNN